MTVDVDKYDEAMLLVDLGRSNTEIIETLTEKYGSGVSTNKLADWRRTSPERMLTRKERIARYVAYDLGLRRMFEPATEPGSILERGVGLGMQQTGRSSLSEPAGSRVPFQQRASPSPLNPSGPESDHHQPHQPV